MKDLYRQVTRHLEVLNVKTEMEEPGMLGFDINMEHSMIGVKIICDEPEKRVMLFAEGTFNVPKVKFQEVLMKINDIHLNEYNSSHLFINVETGHLMSQVVLNADTEGIIDMDVLKFALCDVCYMLDSYYPEFMHILVGADPARISIGKPKKNRFAR